MPDDLSAVAAANSPARRRQSETAIAADSTGSLARFLDLLGRSVLSSNADVAKVQAFDAAGELLDSRRYQVFLAKGDVAAGLAVFARAQRSWHRRREGFEDLWDHGRRFVYGAVNAGGLGTEGEFGPFCLVLDPEHQKADALAVFPGNTAERYASEDGTVDRATALAEATSWADRMHLGVVHRRDEALATDDSGWPVVVCREGHYLEGARAGALPVTAVREVRVRSQRLRSLRRVHARAVARVPLSPVDREQARAYGALLRWRRSYGIPISEVG